MVPPDRFIWPRLTNASEWSASKPKISTEPPVCVITAALPSVRLTALASNRSIVTWPAAPVSRSTLSSVLGVEKPSKLLPAVMSMVPGTPPPLASNVTFCSTA